MNLGQIKKEEPEQQMSIGGQLNVLQEMQRIDYQNSLVMKSLEQYNKKFELLKKEQTELLNQIRSELNGLQESNEILEKNMNSQLQKFSKEQKEMVMGTINKTDGIIKRTEETISQVIEQGANDIFQASTDFERKAEEHMQKSKERSEHFWKRKRIIDYLVFANLAIVPVILIVLVYNQFFK